MTTLPLNQIIVADRLRDDLGDVEELARSIDENGLLQPIVVEKKVELELLSFPPQPVNTYHLRAGGRRYAAFTLLSLNKVEGQKDPSLYQEIPVSLLNEMPAHRRIVIEIEENIRRKDMTWQEKVIGIVKYHKACETSALLDKEKWSQERTGELLNLDQASVSIAFTVFKEIKANNEAVIKAESLTDALKIITASSLDAAQAERMRRIQLKRTESSYAQQSSSGNLPAVSPLPTLSTGILFSARTTSPETIADKLQISLEEISALYYEGSCLDILPKIASRQVINHIICDPPYAIDMSNLGSANIERVEETHRVGENLDLIPVFLQVAFDVIAEDGFLCMWYDLDHHEKIAQWAEATGWKVCRWPLVWCKTSNCANQAAQYNVTKATEVCYLFRRSEKSILKKKQAVNYVLAGTAATSTHPFPKPKEVWNYLIETVSLEGQTIVDPFAGEGSSLAAIFQAKRTPIGIELDPKHIASGLTYIQGKLNKKDILDDLLTSSLI